MMTTNQPHITIITPVWNGMPFLKECIDSVLKQDYQNWQMLISDDGSTDGSRDYLLALNDPRIQVVLQEKNLGIFGNLNFLVKKVVSPFTQILCQDDYFVYPNSLDTIIKYWDGRAEDIGYVRFNQEGENLRGLVALQHKVIPRIVDQEYGPFLFFLFGNIPGNLSNVSFRNRLLIENCGYFSEYHPFSGDFEYWSRCAAYYKFGVENDIVVYVRRHEGVASNFLNKKGELIGQNASIIEKLYTKLSQQNKNARLMLRIHATLNYDILHRDVGVRLWLKKRPAYLKELEKVSDASSYALSAPWRWILFFLSLGGRIGRVSSAKYLLRSWGIKY